MGTWLREGHNNLGKLRTVISCLKHAVRSHENWNRRILLITDTFVALGVLTKERSSSRGLLRLSRIAASYELGLRLSVALRFVHSERNVADGPSLKQKLGVARKLKGRGRLRVPCWVADLGQA